MFCIGIDIAKHKHETSVIRSDRKPLCESVSFSNTQTRYFPNTIRCFQILLELHQASCCINIPLLKIYCLSAQLNSQTLSVNAVTVGSAEKSASD